MSRAPFDPTKTAAARSVREARDIPLLAPLPQTAVIADEPTSTDVTPAVPPLPVRSVKQLNAYIAQTLATNLPETFLVQGEISNFRTYDRGHAFFTLKEPGAELPCILWKDGLARLKFKPKDGMAVLARGAVKMYEPQGRVQLYVETLSPQGTGGLELAFRQLCEKLKDEGLFEAARKRPLPRLPRRVVIITSKSGSVLHDVLTTAYRRFPGLHTMLFPVPVQGDAAAPKIVDALERINRHAEKLGGVDLIYLVRGGGSLEDLWAFNEESVARAIVASAVPVVTGIGHEPDTTIADLVGDLRGPTPTGITELTIPDVRALAREIDSYGDCLTRDTARLLESSQAQLRHGVMAFTQAMKDLHHRLSFRCGELHKLVERIEPRHAIAQGWRRVEDAQRNLQTAGQRQLGHAAQSLQRGAFRLERATPLTRVQRQADKLFRLDAALHAALRARLAGKELKLSSLAQQLKIVSPQAVLERGFSITRDAAGNIVRSKAQIKKGDLLVTKVADGEIKSTVGTPKQSTLF